jgi:hypothetical protein
MKKVVLVLGSFLRRNFQFETLMSSSIIPCASMKFFPCRIESKVLYF